MSRYRPGCSIVSHLRLRYTTNRSRKAKRDTGAAEFEARIPVPTGRSYSNVNNKVKRTLYARVQRQTPMNSIRETLILPISEGLWLLRRSLPDLRYLFR